MRNRVGVLVRVWVGIGLVAVVVAVDEIWVERCRVVGLAVASITRADFRVVFVITGNPDNLIVRHCMVLSILSDVNKVLPVRASKVAPQQKERAGSDRAQAGVTLAVMVVGVGE